jgi:hypothetical protein
MARSRACGRVSLSLFFGTSLAVLLFSSKVPLLASAACTFAGGNLELKIGACRGSCGDGACPPPKFGEKDPETGLFPEPVCECKEGTDVAPTDPLEAADEGIEEHKRRLEERMEREAIEREMAIDEEDGAPRGELWDPLDSEEGEGTGHKKTKKTKKKKSKGKKRGGSIRDVDPRRH